MGNNIRLDLSGKECEGVDRMHLALSWALLNTVMNFRAP